MRGEVGFSPARPNPGSSKHFPEEERPQLACKGRVGLRSIHGVPFDLNQMRVSGPPFVLEPGIRTAYRVGAASIAISQAGTLAFIRGSGFENHRLTWVDREGNVLGTVGRAATMEGVQLSPDGRHAVPYVASDNSDIYIFDVVTGEDRRLTFGEETEGNPVWSPDGRRIAYHQIVSGREKRIFARDFTGQSEPELLFSSGGYPAPRSWSADGNALAFFEGGLLMVLNLDDQSVDRLIRPSNATGIGPTPGKGNHSPMNPERVTLFEKRRAALEEPPSSRMH